MLKNFIIRLVQQSSNQLKSPLYLVWNNFDCEEQEKHSTCPNPSHYSFICSTDPIFETDDELIAAASNATQQRFMPQEAQSVIKITAIALPKRHQPPDLPTLETWLTEDGFAFILLDHIPQAAVVANLEGLKHLETVACDIQEVFQMSQIDSDHNTYARCAEIFQDDQEHQAGDLL